MLFIGKVLLTPDICGKDFSLFSIKSQLIYVIAHKMNDHLYCTLEKMNAARVGIIVRTKDRHMLLNRALKSISNQSFMDWHLFIVNDGGVPKNFEKILELNHQSIQGKYTIQNNHVPIGTSAAANQGLKMLNTQMAIILDDDDTWSPEFLSRMLSVYDKFSEIYPSIKAIACHHNRVKEKITGNLVSIQEVIAQEELLEEGLIAIDAIDKGIMIPSSSFLFELSIAKSIGLMREDLPVLGEWNLQQRFIRRADIYVLAEPLVFIHERSSAKLDQINSQFRDAELRRNTRTRMENERQRNQSY